MTRPQETIENRKEVFLYNLKYNLPTTCLMGVILFLFFVPTICVFAFQTYLVYDVIDTKNIENIFSIYNICNAAFIATFIIFSIGLAGVGQITKNLCWGKVVHLKDDFIKGVKQNCLQCTIIAFLVGVINFAVGLNYIPLNSEVDSYIEVLSTICVIFPILLSPSLIFIFNMIFIYDFIFLKLIKFGLRIFISKLFKTIGFTLLTISPFLLMLIPNSTFKIILLTFMALIYFPFLVQMYFLYSSNVFDQTINPINFPDLINKGIKEFNNK